MELHHSIKCRSRVQSHSNICNEATPHPPIFVGHPLPRGEGYELVFRGISLEIVATALSLKRGRLLDLGANVRRGHEVNAGSDHFLDGLFAAFLGDGLNGIRHDVN